MSPLVTTTNKQPEEKGEDVLRSFFIEVRGQESERRKVANSRRDHGFI